MITLSSCFDTFPLVEEKNSSKEVLYIECDLFAHKDIEAVVYVAGRVDGRDPKLIENDTVTFSLGIWGKDVSYNFVKDELNKDRYYIPKGRVNLNPGERYILRGIGNYTNFIAPSLVYPDPLKVDSAKITYIGKKLNGKVLNNVYTCEMSINKLQNNDAYFLITPKLPNGNVLSHCVFDKDFHAFKPLNHMSGFLVDYFRVSDRTLNFEIHVEESIQVNEMTFELSNVTKSFYYYNYYLSNLGQSSDVLNPNHPIAYGDIRTEKARGNFSACNTITTSYPVK